MRILQTESTTPGWSATSPRNTLTRQRTPNPGYSGTKKRLNEWPWLLKFIIYSTSFYFIFNFRVDLVVTFVCDTIIDEDAKSRGSRLTRNDISCKITYCSVVNPGGWAPASVLRTVYKREYPRFLKRFTSYVVDKTKEKPIMW